MFRKKTEENLLPEGDVRRMIEAIDNIASGDFNEIDATDFNNPLYEDKLNSMLKAVKQVNNPVVMRLNETMEILGDKFSSVFFLKIYFHSPIYAQQRVIKYNSHFPATDILLQS